MLEKSFRKDQEYKSTCPFKPDISISQSMNSAGDRSLRGIQNNNNLANKTTQEYFKHQKRTNS